MNRPHLPVLLTEVLQALQPSDGALYVDGTFGAGGYAEALLQAAACRVVGIDRDPRAIAAGGEIARRFPGRLDLIEGRFGELDLLLAGAGIAAVDGVALDVGVSSMQLDQPERGFSFREDGPLDMRMGADGPSAADVVNGAEEGELADIVFHLGEERRARQVARAIVRARAEQPITRTLQLADLVASVVRASPGLHPATRTFQALRIYVNDELGELENALAAAERLLKPRARLAVVSFHSLEDRLVKRFLVRRAGAEGAPSRHLPQAAPAPPPSFRLLSRGAVKPGAAEQAANPRSRSARLRSAERTGAAPWPRERAA